MPEMRNYKVTQTREVDVVANRLEDAIRIASAAFEHGQNSGHGVTKGEAPEGVWGNTTSQIKETDLGATLKGYLK